jgi:hypothetical protein
MTLMKSALLASATTIIAVASAQAADLPSKKAAPVSYVKVCDAYGAGFFNIPGTDTCVKLGGYVRAEYQYVPGKETYALVYAGSARTNLQGNNGTVANAGTPVYGIFADGTNPLKSTSTLTFTTPITGETQRIVSGGNLTNSASATAKYGQAIQVKSEDAGAQSETGSEIRGRIDVDARTPTAAGPARTFVRVRLANTSGIRNTTITNNGGYTNGVVSTTGPSLESAMVQWAGFTFGVAPENYAMMPSHMYNANPWAGFPNGMKQIAYTARMGGGLSATVALEDSTDMGYSQQFRNRVNSAALIVGNIRLDQAWGFAALHGMVGNNTVQKNWVNYTYVAPALSSDGKEVNAAFAYIAPFSGFGNSANGNVLPSGTTAKTGWALGTTLNVKLPMIAAGDQLWLTANYTDGQLGALLSSGGLSNVNTAANRRLFGGLVRADSNLQVTSSSTFDTVTGWNVAGAFTHYWTSNLRSNFTAGYVEINPPKVKDSSAGIQWGKGQLQVYAAGLVYSPVRDLDIGVEVQYGKLKNQVQNWASTAPALQGLNVDNFTTKLRVERSF